MLQQLQAIEIVGSARRVLTDNDKQNISDIYYSDQYAELPYQTQPTEYQKEQIERTAEAVLAIGREHDLDLSKRVLGSGAYHFYNSNWAMWESLRLVGPTNAKEFVGEGNRLGFVAKAGYYGIVLSNQELEHDGMEAAGNGVIVHEAFHAASHISTALRLGHDATLGFSTEAGYQVLSWFISGHGIQKSYPTSKVSVGSLVNEALTDMATLRADEKYDAADRQRTGIKSVRYPEPMIILGRLIVDTAKDQGGSAEPAEELYMKLEKSMFTGDVDPIRAIVRHLRDKAEREELDDKMQYVKTFLTATVGRRRDYRLLAHGLGLDRAVEDIGLYRASHMQLEFDQLIEA